MSRVLVVGLGAVSPAGWGVPAFRDAVGRGNALPTTALPRPGWTKPLAIRPVPECQPPPAWSRHPRLRRCSAVTSQAVGAAHEALQQAAPVARTRLGVIVCLQGGSVHYTSRFFDEVLKEPAVASPILFPETVLAAPASHVATVLPNVLRVETLLGDPGTFLQGLAFAAEWLLDDQVDCALVIGSEEANWLLADGLWVMDHRSVMAGGAGALCLTREFEAPAGQTSGLRSPTATIELARITDAFTYSRRLDRAHAARQMRAAMPAGAGFLLCDGLQDCPRTDAPEAAAWHDWTGPRLSPKRVLGEGLMAASAWQCVAACDALATGSFPGALVSVVGCNQQAIGACFTTGRPQ